MRKFLLLCSFHSLHAYASVLTDENESSLCSAGPDRVICSSSTQLQGSGAEGYGAWSLVSAPAGGTVAFADNLDPLTMISFSKKETYVLHWGSGGEQDHLIEIRVVLKKPRMFILAHLSILFTIIRVLFILFGLLNLIGECLPGFD